MTGSAPTPEAAWLAAREGLHIPPEQVRRQIGPLASTAYSWIPPAPALERMGFRQVRDLLRLPRKSLTRRFGPALPDYLDRVLGAPRSPRAMYQPPESFSSRLELPAEVHTSQGLLFPLKRMLEELCGVLRGGDNAVQSVRITLGHEAHEDSLLELGLQSPAQDNDRLLTVLRERLERLRLPRAVRTLRVEAPTLLKFNAGQHSLFRDTPAEQKQDIEQLTERLQARLGQHSVAGSPLSRTTARNTAGVRAHWTSPALGRIPPASAAPAGLAVAQTLLTLCDRENYEILAGPERIESGWWDGRDCRRDYFIVRDRHGSTPWAFREYKPGRGWYLHGIFG